MTRRSNAALFAVLAVIALAALWIGGELHRQNCEHTGRVACSVLPWQSGHLTKQDQLRRKYGATGWDGVDTGWGP